MPSSAATVVGAFELLLAAAGLVLLWRGFPRPARGAPSPALPIWSAPLGEFLAFVTLVLLASFTLSVAASFALRFLPLRGDAVTVFSGAAAQLGMLAGVLIFRLRVDPGAFREILPDRRDFLDGATTFLAALPLLMATAKLSELLLERLGLPTDRQDLIGMFAQADSPVLLAAMIALAVVIAPLTEELVFRAGFFRYLRGRMPRKMAFLLPAVFFAALHVNWRTLQGLPSLAPLIVLALLFSRAYERTGRIGVPIVAHALFNLNTVVLILSGAID